MRSKIIVLVVLSLVAILVLGCSTKNIGTLDEPNRGASHFTLAVNEACLIDGASIGDVYLTTADYDTHVLVSVNVSNAVGLKALYFDMTYDPAEYHMMVVEPTEAMGAKDEIVKLSMSPEPGSLTYGQIMTHPEWKTGLTGDCEIATVSFRKEAAPNLRITSVIADGPDSKVTSLVYDDPTDTLTWWYTNTGDYDQDGLVAISDIAAVAQNWNEGTGVLFDIASWEYVVDGDQDGLVSITDLTQIAQNWNQAVTGGYRVYTGAQADIPTDAVDGNGAGVLVDTVTFAGTLNTGHRELTYTFAADPGNTYIWLRPTDSTPEEGIPSNALSTNPADMPDLVLTNPPADSGDGLTAGTAHGDAADDVDYVFRVDDTPGGVDVTATSVFTVSDAGAGTIDPSDGILNLTDGYTGTFSVYAVYNALATDIIWLTTGGGGPGPGDLFIMPDDMGVVPWSDVVTDPEPGHEGDDPGTADNPYVVSSTTFNADGSTVFDLIANTVADGSGDNIPVADLTWDAMPPFIVADATWAVDGQFAIFYDAGSGISFTNGYLFALDESEAPAVESNHMYIVALDAMP